MAKQNNLNIAKFKIQLETNKAGLEKNIADLRSGDPFSDPDHAVDNAAVDTDIREQIGHQTIEAEVDSLKRRLNLIDKALAKIKKNKYGACDKCGKVIPIERLSLVPEASYCIDCEKLLFS